MDFNFEAFNTAAGRFSRDSKELFPAWSRRGISLQHAQSKLAEYLFGYRDLHELQKRMAETFDMEKSVEKLRPTESSTLPEISVEPVVSAKPIKSRFTVGIVGPEGAGKSYYAKQLFLHAVSEGYKIRILHNGVGYAERNSLKSSVIDIAGCAFGVNIRDKTIDKNTINKWNSDADFVSIYHGHDGIVDLSELSLDQCGEKCLFICDEVSNFINIPVTEKGYAILLAKKIIELPYTPNALLSFNEKPDSLKWRFASKTDDASRHFLHLMRCQEIKNMAPAYCAVKDDMVEREKEYLEQTKRNALDEDRRKSEFLSRKGVVVGLVHQSNDAPNKAIVRELINQAIKSNLKIRILTIHEDYSDVAKRYNVEIYGGAKIPFSEKDISSISNFKTAWQSDAPVVVGFDGAITMINLSNTILPDDCLVIHDSFRHCYRRRTDFNGLTVFTEVVDLDEDMTYKIDALLLHENKKWAFNYLPMDKDGEKKRLKRSEEIGVSMLIQKSIDAFKIQENINIIKMNQGKTSPARQALDAARAKVRPGSEGMTLAIIGDSGCGKTTLAKEIIQQAIQHKLKVRVFSPSNEYEDVSRRNNGELFHGSLRGWNDFITNWESDKPLIIGIDGTKEKDFSRLNLAGEFVLVWDEVTPERNISHVAGGLTILIAQNERALPRKADAVLFNKNREWSLEFSDNAAARKLAESMGLESLIQTSTDIVEIMHRR